MTDRFDITVIESDDPLNYYTRGWVALLEDRNSGRRTTGIGGSALEAVGIALDVAKGKREQQ